MYFRVTKFYEIVALVQTLTFTSASYGMLGNIEHITGLMIFCILYHFGFQKLLTRRPLTTAFLVII